MPFAGMITLTSFARWFYLACPQIIVHNTGPDGSLRGAAVERGIHAITVRAAAHDAAAGSAHPNLTRSSGHVPLIVRVA